MNKIIYLAGGCFWGIEAYFSKLIGVATEVGYANGKTKDTTYKTVSQTNHAEVVKITYNDNLIRTAEIIDRFFQIIDPFSLNKQGNDEGTQYRTGIFFEKNDKYTKHLALAFNAYIEKIAERKTEVIIEEIKNYVPAEEYHQKYLKKNPFGYCHINVNSAFNSFGEFKKKESTEIGKMHLDKLSLDVMLNKATERPYSSEFNSNLNKAIGLYVDKISGEPLFTTEDQYDAGCGWPSFSRPVFTTAVDFYADNTLTEERVEVTSKVQQSHLGHVFPAFKVQTPTRLRYCINGVALRFIDIMKLRDTVYEKYMFYFPKFTAELFKNSGLK